MWDDRRDAGWRLAAVGSAMLCGLLGISLGVVKSRAGVIRHREQAPIISPAVATSPDSQIVYFLARFIENARSLSSDPLVVRTSWRNAYACHWAWRGSPHRIRAQHCSLHNDGDENRVGRDHLDRATVENDIHHPMARASLRERLADEPAALHGGVCCRFLPSHRFRSADRESPWPLHRGDRMVRQG
jgi:hypothetical protein